MSVLSLVTVIDRSAPCRKLPRSVAAKPWLPVSGYGPNVVRLTFPNSVCDRVISTCSDGFGADHVTVNPVNDAAPPGAGETIVNAPGASIDV